MQLPAAEFMEDLKAGCESWRVICELAGLGENAEILYQPFGTLSPGERTKVLLAVLFSGDNDFLLIFYIHFSPLACSIMFFFLSRFV